MKKNFSLPRATLERIASEAQEDRQIVEECKAEIATALEAGVPVVRIHEGLAMAGFRGSRGVLADMLEEAGLRQKQLRGDDRIAMLREALAAKAEEAEAAPLPPIQAEIAKAPEPPALPEAAPAQASRPRKTRARFLAEARDRAKTAIVATATNEAKAAFAERKASLEAQGKEIEEAEAQAIDQAVTAALAKDAETRAHRPGPRHGQIAQALARAEAEKRKARQDTIRAQAELAARRAAEETARIEAELAAKAKKEADAEARAQAALDRLAAIEDAIKSLAAQTEAQITAQAKNTARAEEQARAMAKTMINALADITTAQTAQAVQAQKEADAQIARLDALEARLFPPKPEPIHITAPAFFTSYKNPRLKALMEKHRSPRKRYSHAKA